ncbi:hypothetical protein D9V41_08150 [Aeromicrobium phragmitis]|uniref:Uncharacterized protein n=1 Tax=Aeromicrobium phragmitis TaxID=2478914 RepID=A0A3L8PKL9_9ACTN|nr:hypothetical protein [Aeromicrobium phragmitis]RLV55871.1 hypothetical protein D9V41_08150 [Aeromicrobium phragmitis]
MSGDLYIDGAMLRRVKTNFGDIESLLSTPARRMRNMSADQVGPRTLVQRVNEFGDDWGYGIEQLGEFSASVVQALQSIEDAFDAADDNLAAALNEAKEG